MLKLRLTRMGAKDKAHYRIIVQEARSKRDGRFVENVGYYNPRTEPSTIVMKLDRVDYWIKNGAQPTDSVASLLKRARASAGEQVATPDLAMTPVARATTPAVVPVPPTAPAFTPPTEPEEATPTVPDMSAPVAPPTTTLTEA